MVWLADPARHRPARAAGALGAQVREHLDAAGLAAQGLDRDARRRCSTAISASAAIASSCATRCATAARRSRRCSTPSKAAGADRVLVLPLYPQYAASTTASIGDALARVAAPDPQRCPRSASSSTTTTTPATSTRSPQRVNEHWRRPRPARQARAQLPRPAAPHAALGDPYHCECQKTARLLGERLKACADDLVAVTFQSRFGRAEWLQPYTEPTLVALARAGRRTRRRHLPRLHVRLPRDARGDRPGGARRVPRRRRQASSATSRASTTSTNGSPRSPAIAIRHLQGWDTSPTRRPTPTPKRSRRSVGAPSPPARRPDAGRAAPGAPIARRCSARCDKRRGRAIVVPSRPARDPIRTRYKPQEEKDMRQLARPSSAPR